MKNLYPLKFQPILKERIWGGNKLTSVLGKTADSEYVGESWEISDVDKNVSIITNGSFKGTSLKELQSQLKENLIGKKNYKRFKNKFPILVKYIDAKQDLSIQLHPNNELAAKRHNSFGKTEMWYVMQAEKDAELIIGFNQKMDKENYLKHLKKGTLPKILNFEKVKEGDTFFIQVGKIHAIGEGVLLAEIQQTSDITYRIYDWDRVDNDGNSRELHNDLALDAIDFNKSETHKVKYSKKDNTSHNMVTCPFFTTNYIEVTKTMQIENNFDSFVIYLCVDGEAEIEVETHSEIINKGETVLLPAGIRNYSIKSNKAKLLEVYV